MKCFGLASSRPSVRNRSKQFIDSSRAACVYPDFSWLHPAFLITPAAAAGRNRQLMKLCRRLDQPPSPSFPALLPPLWRRGAEIQKLGLPAADSRRALSPYRQSATNRRCLQIGSVHRRHYMLFCDDRAMLTRVAVSRFQETTDSLPRRIPHNVDRPRSFAENETIITFTVKITQQLRCFGCHM